MELPFISSPEGITNHEYHNGERFKEFISSSILENWLISPKYARYKELNPEPEEYKQHFAAGSIWHDMLAGLVNAGNLEKYKRHWHIFEPPINKTTGNAYGPTTNAYQDAVALALQKNPGKELCASTDVERAEIMINELLKGNPHLSPDINFLIKKGKAEISSFCQYQGHKFKYRSDLETISKIIDWKTLPQGAAHPNEVHRQIIKFNYHFKAAFYQFFHHEITGRWKSFYWVFQEKEPPFDFIIESADNWAFEIEVDFNGHQIAHPKTGALLFMKVLEQYIYCRENDYYPGYSSMIQPGFKDQRIHESKVPGWYQNQILEYFNN